jgi:hypothetical protein
VPITPIINATSSDFPVPRMTNANWSYWLSVPNGCRHDGAWFIWSIGTNLSYW